MKLVKLEEETPSYQGKYWSYPQRKFLCYNEWIKEEWPDGSKEKDNQEKNIKSE
tara:strand:+ start:618 stop:779 length:162 start_codon:yes stop_codon:yes gene_type:complete